MHSTILQNKEEKTYDNFQAQKNHLTKVSNNSGKYLHNLKTDEDFFNMIKVINQNSTANIILKG